MKGIKTMKTTNKKGIRFFTLSLLSSFFLFSFLSCEQPFRAGLGTIVDIRPPDLSLVTPGAAESIYGYTNFTGIAEDDYKIERVEFRVTYRVESNKPGSKHDKDYLKDWTITTLQKTAQNKSTWALVVDTNKFPDGALKVMIRAYDAVRPEPVEKGEYTFFVRNDVPKIRLTNPGILEDASGKPGAIGPDVTMSNLNYGITTTLPSSISYPREMMPKSSIRGTIDHEAFIWKADQEIENGVLRYPPQIRLWRISANPAEGYPPGELPPLEEVRWEDLDVFDQGIGKYGFSQKVPTVAGFYGFEIRVQSLDGRVKFHYPRDNWERYEAQGLNWDNLPPNMTDRDRFVENRYVLVYVSTTEDPAVAEYWNLQDFMNGTWNSGTSTYSNFSNVGVHAAHAYVDNNTVDKNGKFIVRVNGKHTQGISDALVFWESKNNGKGVFIWDTADGSGSNIVTNPPTADNFFSSWGYKDTNVLTATNFIFTYDPLALTVNAPGNPMDTKSKIWKYSGNDSWETLKDTLQGRPSPAGLTGWSEFKEALAPDTYTVTVYVISSTDAYVSPGSRSVRLDFTAPDVKFNTIDYEYNQSDPGRVIDSAAKVVNGVIRPRYRFSDSLSTDSGERTATEGTYFEHPIYHTLSTERRYVLVHNDDKGNMDSAISLVDNYWPPVPLSKTDPMVATYGIPNVTVHRHGPIFGEDFMFKTSELYSSGTGMGSSLNPGTYWLYVLSRDKAFNVGYSTPQKIIVDPTTDKPEIFALGEIVDVTDANKSADESSNGFIYADKIRNKLTQSSTLRFLLRDDDSLDLGTGLAPSYTGDASSVTINLAGGKTGYDGEVSFGGDLFVPSAQVKAIFGTQGEGDLKVDPDDPNEIGRAAVRQREGTISQSTLVDLLKADPTYGYLFDKGTSVTSLPDGIYRITITVSDYGLAKLERNGNVNIETTSKTVYFVIDSTPPVIDVATWGTIDPEGWVVPGDISGSVPSASAITTGVLLTGTISDRNGLAGLIDPSTPEYKVTNFEITNGAGQPISSGVLADPDEVKLTKAVPGHSKEQWMANFVAPVHIAETVSSDLIVTLTVKDRFGNSSSHVQRYKIDRVPPNVYLREKISVFERRGERLLGSTTNPWGTDDEFKNLTNGVVKFIITATDDLKVDEVRYWLLPSSTPFLSTPTNTTARETAWDSNKDVDAPDGKYGSKTAGFSDPIYIDTTLLYNGEYNLYVMAKDGAGNISGSNATLNDPPALKQTINIFQPGDAPWFGENTLSGVVGSSNMIASVTIFDDDGFYENNSSNNVRPNTIRIWLTTEATKPGAGAGNKGTYPNYTDADLVGYTASGYLTTGVTSTNRNNIRLSVNLRDIFPTILSGNISGKVHYIIEATDSWAGKFDTSGNLVGNDPANMKTWREFYSFEADLVPPVITITAPASGADFGENPTTFNVVGSISDAHLKKDANDNYVVGIRLDGNPLFVTTPVSTSDLTSFVLGNAVGTYKNSSGAIVPGGYITSITGDTTVAFSIPYSAFLKWTGTGKVQDGSRNLVFTVEDESGQTGNSGSRNFIKDTTPPAFAFARNFYDSETNKTPLPTLNDGLWWTAIDVIGSWATTVKEEYVTKRGALPVITHDGSTVPSISGTFTDALSIIDINTTPPTFKFGWDGAAPTTTSAALVGQLEGNGKSYRWKVYLTDDGTETGNVLTDGVHSIRLTVQDKLGNVLDTGIEYEEDGVTQKPIVQYGFRIVSTIPTATVTGTSGVYGDRAGAVNTPVFTISGTGVSSNLKDVLIRIQNTDSSAHPVYERSVLTPNTDIVPNDTNPATLTWAFNKSGTIPMLAITETLNWSLAIPRSYIMYAGGEGVTSTTAVMLPGNYEITVIAIDGGGKQSDKNSGNTWTFVVDSEAPTFSFNLQSETGDTTVNAANRSPTYWITNNTTRAARNVISSDNPVIGGRVSDNNKLDEVQLQFAQWNYNGGVGNVGAWELYDFTTSAFTPGDGTDADNWQRLVSSTLANGTTYTLANGTTTFTVTGGDGTTALANGSYTLNNGTAFTVQGGKARYTITDYTVNWALPNTIPDGYYSVRLRAKDLSTINGGSTGWGAATGGQATDNGNPVVSQFVYFFVDRDNPIFELPLDETVSSRYKTEYGVEFEFTVQDNNMFESMVATVERINTTKGAAPVVQQVSTTKRSGTGAWTNTATILFIPREVIPAAGGLSATGNAGTSDITGGVEDGAYRVVFTAIDLAGKQTRSTRTITLDNKAPSAKINEPRLVDGQVFASEVKIGGEAFPIAGETSDTGDNGSASMPAGIWYRIGYGTQNAASLQTLLTAVAAAGVTPAQRSALIAQWAVNSGSGLTGVTTDTGATYNGNFDIAAQEKTGSLWFKYTTETGYDVPTGFDAIASSDLYRWSLNAAKGTLVSSVARNYALGDVSLRTQDYTFVNTNGDRGAASGAQYLARQLASNENYYSLPLVVRVVDNAGNVFYELRDIWLYPNGDNPSLSYINPAANAGIGEARGGQISINGSASDNVSVRTVIYRVKVGEGNDTAGTAPLDGNIVTIPDATAVTWGNGTANTLLEIWNKSGSAVTESTTGWYMATPSSNGKNASWNFMVNQSNEINNLMATKGFRTTGSVNNLIRVWVETFVFDSKADGTTNLISLGVGNTNANAPKPDVREFYVTTTAPSINDYRISNRGETYTGIAPNTVWTAAKFSAVNNMAEDNVRNGVFALRARLNGGPEDSSAINIGEISVRTRGETNSDWRPVYVRADGASAVKQVAGVRVTTTNNGATTISGTAVNNAYLNYTFDTTKTTADAAADPAQSIRGGTWDGGKFIVDVRVRNASTPPSESVYTFELGVDNFAPVADTTTIITSTKVAGSNANFMGRVFDYTQATATSSKLPEYGRINEVRVWFTNRVGSYLSMTDNTAPVASIARTGTSVWEGRSATPGYDGDRINVTSITGLVAGVKNSSFQLPNDPAVTTANAKYVKVLKAGASGITWSPADSTNKDVYWSFTQNTANWTDGWIKMHYVVTDEAGNRTYYTQDMIVMNNYPKITNIRLYTNNVGQGAVFTTHSGNEAYSDYVIPDTPYPEGYLNSGFIAKNKIIGFGVDTIKGNGQLYYQARYVERYLVELTKTNLEAMVAAGTDDDATLTHLSNAITINKETGIPSATTSTSDVPGFINLYTIAPGNVNRIKGGAATWRTLGVPVAMPTNGAHFVFQAESANTAVEKLKDGESLGAYVYAYRQVGSIYTADPVKPTAVNGVYPIKIEEGGTSPLLFQDTDFGAGGIPEARPSTASTAVPETNATGADSNGSAFFIIKVWDTVDENLTTTGDRSDHDPTPTGKVPLVDNDMLFDAIVIGMDVYLSDKTPPWARLYDLNPYTETAVIGGNGTDSFRDRTLAAAASPGSIDTGLGYNVLRGGLYNIGTAAAPVKSGYIDPRNGSTALRPRITNPSNPSDPFKTTMEENANGFIDANATLGILADSATTGGDTIDKASGSVILRGLAWDDQFVDEVKIKIGSDAQRTILRLGYVTVATGLPVAVDKHNLTSQNMTDINAGIIAPKMLPLAYIHPNGTVYHEPNSTQITTLALTPIAWAYEEIHWKAGHTVEWAYLWNTELEPSGRARGGPLTSVTVAVEVKDLKGDLSATPVTPPPGLPSVSRAIGVEAPTATPAVYHNSVAVEIRPYITGIRRADQFATNRSRQGWYSFFQGEPDVRLLGYNLGTSAATVNYNTTDAAGGTSMGGTWSGLSTEVANNNRLPNDGNTFTVPTGAASGRINVTAGGTEAWNRASVVTTRSWNREKSATSGSDLWNNKLYMHVWRTNEQSTAPVTYFGDNSSTGGSWNLDSPSMVLEYGTTSGMDSETNQTTGTGAVPGRLHGAWGIRENFGVYYGANDGYPRIRQQVAQDPMSYTDMAYYPGTNNTNNMTVVYVYQWDALPNVLLRTHVKHLKDGDAEVDDGDPALGKNGGGTIAPFLVRRDERGNQMTDTLRWKNIRTSMTTSNVNTGTDGSYNPHNNGADAATANTNAARGNAGRVYASIYDSVGFNLGYVTRSGTTNWPAPSRNTLPHFIDGGNAGTGTNGATDLAVANITDIPAGATYTVTTRSPKAGNWSAVDYIGTGTNARPVIAYYDEYNDTLRLAYGTTIEADAAGEWIRRYVLASNDPLFKGSGKYVSIKVDKNDNIHLAFYNSTLQTVVYAVGTTTTAFTAVAVDSVISGGTWTDISVDNSDNPWIVYGDSGRTGNYDGARIAYKNATMFEKILKDPNGKVITGWEAVTMPANYTVSDDRLNIEVWPPTGRAGVTPSRTATGDNAWQAAVGYAGTDTANTRMFRIGYFYPPAIAAPK